MKQVLWYFVIVMLSAFVALLGERALFPALLPPWCVPQFIVILVVYLSFQEPRLRGLFSAFLVGLMADFAGAVLLGPWVTASVVVFVTLFFLSQHVFGASGLVIAVAVFASTLLAHLVAGVVRLSFADLPLILNWDTVGQACISAVLAPLVCASLQRCFRGHNDRR